MISVLYVDDEPNLLEVGKLFLERNSELKVGTVTSGYEALERIQGERFDAIISDYQMPGMNGIELLKAVREQFGDLPFIIFTGRGREEVVIQALNEGVDFYLQKGGDAGSQFAELVHKVRQAVSQRRALTSIREHERREADIINFLPDATFAIDNGGVVIAWNRAIEKLTGVKSEEIVGKGDYEYAIPFYHERRPILIDLVINDDPVTAAKYPSIEREGSKLKSEIHLPHFNDGQGADFWFTASPLYDIQGNVIGAIESIREITERKKVEAALNESERRFRELADLLPQIIFEADEEQRLTYTNRIAFETFKFSEEDFRDGILLMEVIAPRDRERVEDVFYRIIKEGVRPDVNREYMALRRDGSTFPVSIYSSPVIRNEKVVGVRGIVIDNTDRKHAEEKIRESEQNYRLLFENATEGILVAQGDRMVHVNPALVSLLDRPMDVITSRSFTDFIHPDDREKVMSRHLQRMKGDNPTTGYTFRIITGAGEERWVRINSTRMEWSGNPATLSFITDITKQKKAEVGLLSANEEYTNLLNQIQDVYYRSDTEGRLIKASHSWVTLLGYDDISDCLGRSIEEFWQNPSERKGFLEEVYRDGKVTNYEISLKKRDSTPVIIETSSHLYYDGEGETLGIEGTFRDITERKRQESILGIQLDLGLALQKTRGMQETLGACLDAAIKVSGMDSGGIYLVDEEKGAVDLFLSKNLGDEFVASVSHYLPGSDHSRMVMEGVPHYMPYSELAATYSPIHEREEIKSSAFIPITAGGRSIACLNIASHKHAEIPEATRFALETIATQISTAIKRIKAEDALSRSEQRYRNVVEDQTEFISRFLPDGTHVFVNDAYCRYFHFAREEILGHRFRPRIPMEDKERVEKFFESLTPDSPIGTIEHRIVMPDGRIRWQWWSDRAIFDPDGTIMEYQSVGRDITETKEAEHALAESEAYYRSLAEASNDLIFMIDRDDNVTYVNKFAVEMLGKSRSDILGRKRSSLFPEDVSIHQHHAIERVFETGERIRSSGQIVFGGIPHWLDHSLVPVRDTEGNITRVLGISRDITELKRIEEELQEKTEELESHNRVINTLLDTVPIGIYMVKAPSGKPIIANREAIRLFGRAPRSDMTAEGFGEIFKAYKASTGESYPPDEMPLFRGMKGEASHVDDMVVQRSDGSRVRIEVFGTPVINREGRVVASLVSFLDITDRKEAEEMIRRLAQFPRENPHPVLRFAADDRLLYANKPGKAWLQAFACSEKRTDEIQAIVKDTMDNEGVHVAELGDDSGRVYEVTAVRPDGEQYVNLYISDVTERKRAETAIKETNEKINLLTSITRHDVANQVTVLRGFAQVALMNEPDPATAEVLQKIDAVGSTIMSQIEFTRAYQELGMHAPGWYNVKELVDTKKPENLVISCTCDAEIYGDPMLGKVFSNIIENAAMHGKHATKAVVSCKEDPEGFMIIIEDDGIGVPYEEKERIFEKGYGTNTGFGLFLVREILAITGITIRETGIPGKGARFELHIPKGNLRPVPESGDVSG
jgi:PAS domain S-box-containing protein